MEINKRIDLGEYIILLNYNEETGSLEVQVLDELEDLIESINITNDEDEDNIDDPFNGFLN